MSELPNTVAFQGRLYRLDRVAAVLDGDLRVVSADRARIWAERAKSAQLALDLHGADRERVAVCAGQLQDLSEEILAEVAKGDP
jgi:hypothetical protein